MREVVYAWVSEYKAVYDASEKYRRCKVYYHMHKKKPCLTRQGSHTHIGSMSGRLAKSTSSYAA